MAAPLQVSIADLEAIEAQLGTQSDALNSSSSDAQTIVNDVVAQLQNAANSGESRMTSLLSNLDNVSQQTLNATNGAVWTGQNSERFRAATGDLTTTINNTNRATEEAFAQFRNAIVQLEESLNGLVTDFQASAGRAEESTLNFRDAIRSQAENYDHAFNASLG